MEMDFLKKVIEEQRVDMESRLSKGDIIERDGMEHAGKFLGHPNVLSVMGVRRCGKSVFTWLLSRMVGGRACYINFDDERLMGLKTEDLDRILQAFHELYGDPEIIILDEIQRIPGWEMFASRLRTTKKVIVTGSSSSLLAGELSTHLTGRHIDFTLYPFSFREVCGPRKGTYLSRDLAEVNKKLESYLHGSGFPEFSKFGPAIVTGIYEDIINKDCITRYAVRDRKSFRELAHYMISNYSCEFTYSKLARLFGIKDVHTAKNYVSYLSEAFLITVLERFSPKLKQQVIAPKKVYAVDHGLCNFVSFSTTNTIGRVMENVVCVELMRKKSRSGMMKIFYWKNHMQHEVDFVVMENRKITQLIQVCYDLGGPGVMERELGSLLDASEELSCSDLLVITGGHESTEKHGDRTVRFVPLWKWLLEGK